MASLALGAVGAFIGFEIGGPTGAQIGWMIGAGVGSMLERQSIDGPHLQDLTVQVSTVGNDIPIIYGAYRVAGNCIWSTDLVEHAQDSGGGKGGGGPSVTTYTYSVSTAIALCAGPIVGVRKIWADGLLIYETGGANPGMTVYLGDENQLPDPTIESHMGAGNVPAYRGLAYIVFTDFDLSRFGNRLPNFSFEVVAETGTPYVTQTLQTYSNPTAIGTFFSAPAPSLSGTVVLSWGYYFGYAGVQSISMTAGGITQLGEYTGSNPGDEPSNGYSDTPGAYVPGVWMDAVTMLPINVNIPGLSAFNVETSYVKRGNAIWVTSNYGGANYHIYRGDLTDASAQVISSLTGPYAILGVSANYLYVVQAYTSNILRFNPNTLALVDTIACSSLIDIAATGYVVDDHTVYACVNGVGVYKVDVDTGAVTFLFPLWIASSISVADNGDIIYVTGNSLSQISLCLAQAPAGTTVGAIVGDLCSRAGMTPDQYDVSALFDPVPGYAVSRNSSPRVVIEQLQTAFFFDPVESGTKMKFVKRGGEPAVTIPISDLAAVQWGQTSPDPISIKRLQEVDLPKRVAVVYADASQDYQMASQYALRTTTSAIGVVSQSLPMVLDNQTARQIAETLMYEAWTARTSFGFSTTQKYGYLEPTDVVVLVSPIAQYRVRVIKKSEQGALINFEAIADDGATYARATAAGISTQAGQVIVVNGPSALLLMDIPLLRDQDDGPGFYVAMGAQQTAAWPGATLFKSIDNGATWSQGDSVANSAAIGATLGGYSANVLADFHGGNVVDHLNSLTVVMHFGATLASCTELAMLNGANAALVGNEIIQFRTATLAATNTYVLTDLLRGRCGTEWAMGAHVANETFVLFSMAGTLREAGTTSELNLAREYQAVTNGLKLNSGIIQSFTNTGAGLKPFSPVQLMGIRDTAHNLTINWIRRGRKSNGWLDNVDVPLSETAEAYELEIWDASFVTLKRTVVGVASPTYAYTAANQTADFGSPQSSVGVRVFQISSIVGRGFPARAAL